MVHWAHLQAAAAGDSLTDDEELDMDEGQFKREMTDDAQQMDLIDFVDKYSDYGEEEASAMWHDMNEEAAADMDEGAVKNAMIDDAEVWTKKIFVKSTWHKAWTEQNVKSIGIL